MTSLKVGMPAPPFKLPSSKGREISLEEFRNQKNVVLYFYPKDDTPGCTIEACDFRDNLARLNKADTVVLGVSMDDLKSHQKFIKKFNLPFPLLSDVDRKVIDAYDVWDEKTMFGKTFMGIERTTFLINKKGIIQKIWWQVTVPGHVEEVLAEIGPPHVTS